MKKSTLLLITGLLISFSLSAQFRLNIEGDAKILGRLELDSGMTNSFIGKFAGEANTTGSGNTFMGVSAGKANTTGLANTFMGASAGFLNQGGDYNTFLGFQAGNFNTEGFYNVFVGSNAGIVNSTGSDNTFIGEAAGSENLSGTSNTALGSGANFDSNDLANATAIGAGARVAKSNSLVLGNSFVNVGIGTSAPDYKLDVVGDRIKLTDPDNSAKFLELRTDGGELDLAAGGGQLFLSSYGGEGVILEQLNGNVGIGNDSSPDFKLEVVGTAGKPGGGMWSDASDKRLKTDVEDFEDGLEQIRQIRPVWYRFKGDFSMPTKERYVGVIAQEMQKVAPYTVTPYRDTDQKSGKSGEFLSYNGTAVIYMLVNAAQEMAETADEQARTIAEQQQSLRQFQSVMQDQQQQIGELTELVHQLLTQSPSKPSVQKVELEGAANLSQNRPNPFPENTTIDYFLPEGSENARMAIYSLNGQLITSFPLTQPGKGQVQLKAGRFPAGTYLYSLIIDNQVLDTKKMVLTKGR